MDTKCHKLVLIGKTFWCFNQSRNFLTCNLASSGTIISRVFRTVRVKMLSTVIVPKSQDLTFLDIRLKFLIMINIWSRPHQLAAVFPCDCEGISCLFSRSLNSSCGPRICVFEHSWVRKSSLFSNRVTIKIIVKEPFKISDRGTKRVQHETCHGEIRDLPHVTVCDRDVMTLCHCRWRGLRCHAGSPGIWPVTGETVLPSGQIYHDLTLRDHSDLTVHHIPSPTISVSWRYFELRRWMLWWPNLATGGGFLTVKQFVCGLLLGGTMGKCVLGLTLRLEWMSRSDLSHEPWASPAQLRAMTCSVLSDRPGPAWELPTLATLEWGVRHNIILIITTKPQHQTSSDPAF